MHTKGCRETPPDYNTQTNLPQKIPYNRWYHPKKFFYLILLLDNDKKDIQEYRNVNDFLDFVQAGKETGWEEPYGGEGSISLLALLLCRELQNYETILQDPNKTMQQKYDAYKELQNAITQHKTIRVMQEHMTKHMFTLWEEVLWKEFYNIKIFFPLGISQHKGNSTDLTNQNNSTDYATFFYNTITLLKYSDQKTVEFSGFRVQIEALLLEIIELFYSHTKRVLGNQKLSIEDKTNAYNLFNNILTEYTDNSTTKKNIKKCKAKRDILSQALQSQKISHSFHFKTCFALYEKSGNAANLDTLDQKMPDFEGKISNSSDA